MSGSRTQIILGRQGKTTCRRWKAEEDVVIEKALSALKWAGMSDVTTALLEKLPERTWASIYARLWLRSRKPMR